jgi:hypothetical protein
MTEAFEIGISLALADGVSEGIAKAQRDADAVTRAAGAGALSVQRLQKAGVAALTVMRSARDLAASVSPAESARSKAALPPVAATGSVERSDNNGVLSGPVAVAAAAPLAQPSAPVIVPAAPAAGDDMSHADEGRTEVVHSFRLDQHPVPVDPQPAVRVIDQPERPGEDRRLPLATPVQVNSPLRTVDRPRAVGAKLAEAVAVPPARPAGTADAGSSAAPTAAGPRGGERLALRLDMYGGRRSVSTSEPSAQSAVGAVGPVVRTVAEPTVQRAQVFAKLPAAPVAPVLSDVPQPRPTAQERSLPDGAEPQQAAEEPGGGADALGGPSQGDVFLDGALVGRWMSRHLSREAGRASAGPTGFDQRRNPLLPGATVGG